MIGVKYTVVKARLAPPTVWEALLESLNDWSMTNLEYWIPGMKQDRASQIFDDWLLDNGIDDSIVILDYT